MNSISQSDYRSWMLRLRRSGPHDRWHYSLQCTTTGQIMYFTGLDMLMAYLNDAAVEVQFCPTEPI